MRFLTAMFFALVAAPLFAADPKPEFEPLLTKPGKVIFHDEMKDGLAKEWKATKGKWTANEGGTRVVEVAEDMHGAVARRDINGKDFLIQVSFKLDKAKTGSISINNAKSHVCRLTIKPTGFSIQKDDTDGKNGPDKAEVLQTKEIAIKPGEWHTIQLEFRGEEIVGQLDGKLVAFGSHKVIDGPKANIGLTCAGRRTKTERRSTAIPR
jgi:hypothetical protein